MANVDLTNLPALPDYWEWYAYTDVDTNLPVLCAMSKAFFIMHKVEVTEPAALQGYAQLLIDAVNNTEAQGGQRRVDA